jgi:hypothetical protein
MTIELDYGQTNLTTIEADLYRPGVTSTASTLSLSEIRPGFYSNDGSTVPDGEFIVVFRDGSTVLDYEGDDRYYSISGEELTPLAYSTFNPATDSVTVNSIGQLDVSSVTDADYFHGVEPDNDGIANLVSTLSGISNDISQLDAAIKLLHAWAFENADLNITTATVTFRDAQGNIALRVQTQDDNGNPAIADNTRRRRI